MKIIVDELPKESKDCICFHNGFCTILSDTDTRRSCYKDVCPLKPITDFHAEEIVGRYDDGTHLVRNLDIK